MKEERSNLIAAFWPWKKLKNSYIVTFETSKEEYERIRLGFSLSGVPFKDSIQVKLDKLSLEDLTDIKKDVNVECYLNKEFDKWVPTKESNIIDCISEIS